METKVEYDSTKEFRRAERFLIDYVSKEGIVLQLGDNSEHFEGVGISGNFYKKEKIIQFSSEDNEYGEKLEEILKGVKIN